VLRCIASVSSSVRAEAEAACETNDSLFQFIHRSNSIRIKLLQRGWIPKCQSNPPMDLDLDLHLD
jgi:hypothetical protein